MTQVSSSSASATKKLAVALAVVVTLAETAGAQIQLPDTPAGRQFAMWLDMFNTADRARRAEFADAYFPAMNVERSLSFRERTGGFELLAVEESSPTKLTGRVEQRDPIESADVTTAFVLEVEPEEPHRITRLQFRFVRGRAESSTPRPIPRMSEAEALAALREDLEKAAAADEFSGAVLVAKNGKTLFQEAYGFADRENEVANTVKTRFRIGSMNKMFTATSVLQLVQLGKVQLTDPLGKHVADYPNQDVATKVTIHHLLTHTGGTGDIFGPEYRARRMELRTLEDYVALYGSRPLAFEPGSRWAYSNYGMVLLGVVIERVSGMSYYDYVAKHVYEPAGMNRSGSEPESDVVRERSIGYTRPRGGGAWTPNSDTLPYRGTSAGGGYSTVGDLKRFADALLGHKLLATEHTELLVTGKVDSAGGRRYAYGFEDGRDNDGAGAVGHGGGAPGMNGDLKIYPRSGYVVAVLSNLDPPAAQRVSTFLDARLPQ